MQQQAAGKAAEAGRHVEHPEEICRRRFGQNIVASAAQRTNHFPAARHRAIGQHPVAL